MRGFLHSPSGSPSHQHRGTRCVNRSRSVHHKPLSLNHRQSHCIMCFRLRASHILPLPLPSQREGDVCLGRDHPSHREEGPVLRFLAWLHVEAVTPPPLMPRAMEQWVRPPPRQLCIVSPLTGSDLLYSPSGTSCLAAPVRRCRPGSQRLVYAMTDLHRHQGKKDLSRTTSARP